MTRLWVRMIKHHRVQKQETPECTWENIGETLTEVCRTWDVPRPIWLGKHEREMNDFRRTAFTAEHFMEEIPFDRLEIEFLEDLDAPRQSKDPRNAF